MEGVTVQDTDAGIYRGVQGTGGQARQGRAGNPGGVPGFGIGRGIERIYGIGQFLAKVLAGVERACFDDQPLNKLEVNAPVAQLVGVGHTIELIL